MVGTAAREPRERMRAYFFAKGIVEAFGPDKMPMKNSLRPYCSANKKTPMKADVTSASDKTFSVSFGSPDAIAFAYKLVVAIPMN